jgi:site-specific DNA recombinase
MMAKEGLRNRKGKPLSKPYFYRMLTNEVYAGWIVKFGERHRGAFAPIISDQLFARVQWVIKGKGKRHSQHLTDNPDFPLRRFVVNAEGKKLTGSWSTGRYKKYPFYRFGGNQSNHNREVFETTFMEYMDSFAFDTEKLSKLKELVGENLVKATLHQRKETERLQKHLRDLEEKQSGIIQKNHAGIIPDNVLKQQLALIDNEITEANAALSISPATTADYTAILEFIKEYLLSPSDVWKNAKIGVRTKLQWFQFPSGLVFENNLFRTTEVSKFFKAKELISAQKYSKVDFGLGFWNHFAKESEYLKDIIQEYKEDSAGDCLKIK